MEVFITNKKLIDYDILYNLYIIQGLKIKEICKILNSSSHTIGRELKKYKLTKHFSEYKKTHGMSNTRAYKIWQQMKVRCDNFNSIHFNNYGGKGITYDKKWKTFEGFWEDMKGEYNDALTLDRINNDKGYCKNNCRWVSYTEQNNNNKGDNVNTIKSVKEIMKITGLSSSTIYRRIRNGWSEEKIINTPKLTSNGR